MKGRLEFEEEEDILPQRPQAKWGNLQSCQVKSSWDERTFERIAIHRILDEYQTVEFDSVILVEVQYEMSLDDAPRGSLSPHLTSWLQTPQSSRLLGRTVLKMAKISVSLVISGPSLGPSESFGTPLKSWVRDLKSPLSGYLFGHSSSCWRVVRTALFYGPSLYLETVSNGAGFD